MKHKMWYDDKDDLLYLEFVSDYLFTDVEPILNNIKTMLTDKPFRQLIIKMSDTYKVENRATREASNKGMQEAEVTEVAFVGGSAANRMIARVLLKTGMIKIKGDFFKNYEDAIKWLKSKRA